VNARPDVSSSRRKRSPPFDHDVHPSIVEHFEHLEHRCARADLVHGTVAGREDEAKVRVVLDAFLDQLAVAGLEDM